MSSEIRVGDIGTEFRITITDDGAAVDLSSAPSLVINFRKPDGNILSVYADLYTDGTDGIIFYNAVNGDLDQSGQWKIQAVIETGGAIYSSSVGTFKVSCNLV